MRAETAAMDMLVDILGYYKTFFDLFWPKLRIEIGTDANDLVQLLKAIHPRPVERSMTAKIRQLQDRLTVVSLYALSESLHEGRYLVYHIATDRNIADALTKPCHVSNILKLIDMRP